MTRRYLPMLAATAGRPFSSGDWLFEVKWDGVRAIAYIANTVALISRSGRDLAGRFPELAELRDLAPGTVLDGEIVVMQAGKPDIQALLPRLQAQGGVPPDAPPVTYIVFDILEKDGEPLTEKPLILRRAVLQSSVREGPHVVISEPVDTRGKEYYRAAVAQGLEGIMAKRKDSLYEPGVRSTSWLKIRPDKTCDCIIAGTTQGQGARSGTFGALLLALYPAGDAGGRDIAPPVHGLVYIGKVGSGFSDRDLTDLVDLFANYRTDTPTLSGVPDEREVSWLRPELVCEVAYQQVTRDLRLRIPRFRRLRTDRRPEDCRTDQFEVQAVPADAPAARGAAPVTRMRIAGSGIAPGAGIRMRRHEPSPGPARPPQVADHDEWERSSSRPGTKGAGGDGSGAGEQGPDDDDQTGEREYGPPAIPPLSARPTEQYREKRNFSATPEPEGVAQEMEKTFVVQEHHARHLHYDFRLERDGVLKSWAVPKGVPETPGPKHLAVAVEDHPLDYATFEGTIPEGEYGAGTVSVWDTGTYETKHWDEKKIEVILHGKRLTGHYVLVPFHRAGKNEWIIFRAGAG